MAREPTLRIFPIVEGHGEVQAIRRLLTRIGFEILDLPYIEILTPLRRPKTLLAKESELIRAMKLAALKLAQGGEPGDAALILLLVDADEDLPCELAPRWLDVARQGTHVTTICTVANPEYETWFVAAAESLGDYLELEQAAPEDPEGAGLKKAWVQRRLRGRKYSETVEQPRLTAAMDLQLCRRRSPSFDKLCRDLERMAAEVRS